MFGWFVNILSKWRPNQEKQMKNGDSETLIGKKRKGTTTLPQPPVKMRKFERCAICLQDMNVPNLTEAIQCAHVFHQACIKRALQFSSFCPYCRHKVKLDDGEGEAEEGDESEEEAEEMEDEEEGREISDD